MKALCVRSFLIAAAFTAVVPLRASAADFLLTMDDLPNQPVDGLAHPNGVEFGFTVAGVPSLDAQYAAFGPNMTVFTQDPSIEGNSAGVLFVSFPEPTGFVQFGVARNTNSRTIAIVEAFNAANVSLGVTNVPLSPMPTFSEGLYNYNGPAMSRLTLAFGPPDGGRFVMDNLFFRTIPEPASFTLFGIGAAMGVVGCGRRRHRA